MNWLIVLLGMLSVLMSGCSSMAAPGSQSATVARHQREPGPQPKDPVVSGSQTIGSPGARSELPRSAPIFELPESVFSTTESPLTSVSPLDLEHWPFGWVTDSSDALRLGLPTRFWSDQKRLWTLALEPQMTPSGSVTRWERIRSGASSKEEAFRAVWHLWSVYRRAGLYDDARVWLDRAAELRASAVVGLERAWDQLFRLKDVQGAQVLFEESDGPWQTDEDLRKARLLRQRLFLGQQDLASVGADGYISTVVLDRDDLWAGTWNGAVVRWSLPAGTIDLILDPPKTVAPVKLLAATGWFLYAFLDKGVQRYSKVTGTWRSFSYPAGWTGLRVQAVVADGEESLWVAYLGQGLWHWQSGQWFLVDGGGGGPFLNALASDGQGGFWIGTKDRGLWSWRQGQWNPVPVSGASMPMNISVLQSDPSGLRWAVGTWGSGAWILEHGVLSPISGDNAYITAVTWTPDDPVWGTLDQGLFSSKNGQRLALGPLDGLPSGVTSLVSWEGRWLWGTNGQGLESWSEYENSALLR